MKGVKCFKQFFGRGTRADAHPSNHLGGASACRAEASSEGWSPRAIIGHVQGAASVCKSDLACSGVRDGQPESNRASKALICGAAKLLPVTFFRSPPSHATSMSWPRAANSTSCPSRQKNACASAHCEKLTVVTLGK